MRKNELIEVIGRRKESFSIIEVYPSLNYLNTKKKNEEDLQSIFQLSLDTKRCLINIRVRSKEAQEEISSYLIGRGGFEDVQCFQGNVVGMNQPEQKIIEDLEPGEILSPPMYRRYYTVDSKMEDIMMSRSNLSIQVGFEIEELSQFKKTLYRLRKERGYKNKWLGTDSQFIIR